MRRTSRRILGVLAVVLVGVVVAAVVGYRALTASTKSPGPPCQATAGQSSYTFDAEQAAIAATVAAVGKRLGLPDHAVTIALAAALQESRLRNLSYGDLDSLGVFQQRPSQGWGTAAEIMSPRYAATAFYGHLSQIPDWQTLSVTDAAQAVQHSAAPNAYAQWDPEARVLAQALTGEVPAGFSCRLSVKATAPSTPLATAMAAELGPGSVGASVSPARGWLIAGWLIGHAVQYGVASVTVNGQRWTAKSGTWAPHAPTGSTVSTVEINH